MRAESGWIIVTKSGWLLHDTARRTRNGSIAAYMHGLDGWTWAKVKRHDKVRCERCTITVKGAKR